MLRKCNLLFILILFSAGSFFAERINSRPIGKYSGDFRIEAIPQWLVIMLLSVGVGLILLIICVIVLRIRVKKRTSELKKNHNLVAQLPEERFRAIFEGAAEGIIVGNIETKRFKYVNRAICEMLGYMEEEMLQMSVPDIHPEEAMEDVISHFNRQARGEEKLAADIPCLSKNGTIVYTDIMTAMAVIDGEPCNVGFFTDVSRRKLAEEALNESDQRYRITLDSMDDCIHVVDADLKIVFFNKAFERFNRELGLTTNVLDRPLAEVFPFLSKNVYDEYRSVFESGKIITTDDKYEFGSGEIITETRKIPVFRAGEVERIVTVIRDINEQKQIEDALKESEERYRSIFDSTTDAFLIFDANGYIVEANLQACKMYGYPHDELTSISGKEIVHPDKHHLFEQFKRDIQDTGEFHAESVDVRKDGSCFDIDIKGTLFNYRGSPHLLAVVRDITDRKQAEMELHVSEEKFHKAFMFSPNLMLIFLPEESRIIDINDRCIEKLDYRREEIIGHSILELNILTLEDYNEIKGALLSEMKIHNYELPLRGKSGKMLLGSLSAEVIEIKEERHIIVMIEDITEARQLQREIMNISEMERQRLGRDLHDDLGQDLTGATFLIQSLKQELAEKPFSGISELEKVDELIRNALTKTRSISRMLSPVEMDKNGLISAIVEMAEHVENVFKISCEVVMDGEILIDDIQISSNLYYIVREAVNNAIKHSNADRIQIVLRAMDTGLNMAIEDNGSGMKEGAEYSGMGLRIMKYRANLIGAQINFFENEHGGFSVELRMQV